MKLLISLFSILYLFCLIQDAQSFSFPSIGDLFGYSSDKNETTISDASASNATSDDDEICFGDIGCFKKKKYLQEDGLPSFGIFAPSDPNELNITILYFNDLDDKGDPYNFTSTKIKDYIPGKKAYFLIHGWQSGFEYESWIDDLKDTVLRVNNGSVNVFVIDWSKQASSILYPKSAEDTKSVASAIGYFILKTLVKNYRLNTQNVHVLGHSLGGQTAGFIGQYTQKHNYTIGRITALDAAGPFFRDKNKTERVDESDATFVEALHTNAAAFILGGLGTVLKSGTVDYYANDGTTQTGCQLKDGLADLVKNGILDAINAPSCSHVRAPQIYSVNYDNYRAGCQLVAYQCKSFESFTKGECGDCGKDGSMCRFVGLSAKYDSSKAPKPKNKDMKFFMKTTDKAPYCQHTYQIKLTTSKRLDKTATGSIYVNLIGHKRDATDIKIASPLTGFEANKTYTFLLEKKDILESIERIELYYYQSVKLIDMLVAPNLQVYVQKVEVNYLSHIDPKIRKQNSGVFLAPEEKHEISKSADKRTVFNRLRQ